MHDISSDCSRTSASGDAINAMVDAAYRGHVDRRRFMKMLIAAGVSAAVARDMAEQAAQAQSNQAVQLANLRSEYDYIVVGAGAAGCVMAHRLSQNGQASVLVIEGGGTNLDQEKISNPRHLYAQLRLRHRLGLQVDAAAGAQQPCHRSASRQDHRRRLEHQRHGLAEGRQGRLRRLGGGGRSRLGLRGDHPQLQEGRALSPAAQPRSAAATA